MDEVTADHPTAAAGDPAERRTTRRKPALKSAKVLIGPAESVHNCLVLDKSAGGVLIDLGAVIRLPDEVTLQLANGARYLARCRWSAGTKAGLEFAGAPIVSDEMALRMGKIVSILRTQGLEAAMATLRFARFFDNPELRRVAEEAEAAQARLVAVLGGKPII